MAGQANSKSVTARPCGQEDCTNLIAPERKANARYCSDACRQKAHRRRHHGRGRGRPPGDWKNEHVWPLKEAADAEDRERVVSFVEFTRWELQEENRRAGWRVVRDCYRAALEKVSERTGIPERRIDSWVHPRKPDLRREERRSRASRWTMMQRWLRGRSRGLLDLRDERSAKK